MAARRLMIVMLVLLGISALAAALVPTRESNEETVGSTSTEATGGETTAAEPAKTEEEASPTFDIKVGGGKLPIVPVSPGQRVTLVVRSRTTDQLEIPALGLIEPVAPGAPARFELLIDAEPGDDLGIRLIGEDRVVARIEVRPEAREESGRPESKNRGEPGRS